ncbi:hypothetical protein CR513_45217, partial [Mucuna pruriens]
MDKIFKEVIDCDVEVYLDDMVVKSAIVGEHCAALERKGESFVWTVECEEAFLRLKVMLAAPYPHSSNPSAALIQEKEGTQHPIYFTSKVLYGAERRYQRIEKATLTLVITSRRLRPYFQGYQIIVRIDLPIRQVLRKPYLAGRMVAWSVQLLEFDISFEKWGHLTPVDVLTAEDGEWFLLVEGSSNQIGSGVGIILEGPDVVLIEQSLHFEFKASNNQAEYEASDSNDQE